MQRVGKCKAFIGDNHRPLYSQSHNLLSTAAFPVSLALSPLPPSPPLSVQSLPRHHRRPGVSVV